MDQDLKDKICLITGSGSGIGKATAIEFARLGSQIIIVDVNEIAANGTKTQCSEVSPFNYEPLVIHADLTKEEDIERIVKQTIDHYGQVDVLVNNAGVASIETIDSQDLLEKYRYCSRINVEAPILLTQLFVPYLIRTKGCIVNVSSIVALCPGLSIPYTLSKAALTSLTKLLSRELGPKGVRVNEVNPNMTDTNIFLNAGMEPETSKAAINKYKNKTPLRAVNQPSDVANAIVFLSSSKAAMINGHSLVIDGGILQTVFVVNKDN